MRGCLSGHSITAYTAVSMYSEMCSGVGRPFCPGGCRLPRSPPKADGGVAATAALAIDAIDGGGALHRRHTQEIRPVSAVGLYAQLTRGVWKHVELDRTQGSTWSGPNVYVRRPKSCRFFILESSRSMTVAGRAPHTREA